MESLRTTFLNKGKNDALTGCMFPVEEICQPTEEYPQGEPPSWTGCQIAYEDRPQ